MGIKSFLKIEEVIFCATCQNFIKSQIECPLCGEGDRILKTKRVEIKEGKEDIFDKYAQLMEDELQEFILQNLPFLSESFTINREIHHLQLSAGMQSHKSSFLPSNKLKILSISFN